MNDLQGSNMNFTALVFEQANVEHPALVFQSEIFEEPFELSWEELQAQVTSLADYLTFVGIQKGDVVAGYMPNIPEAIMAYLATAAVGGVWFNLDPKSNNAAAISILQQSHPKVLIAVDGIHWQGEKKDHLKLVNKIVEKVESLKKVVIFPYCTPDCDRSVVKHSIFWNETYNGAAQAIDYANSSAADNLIQLNQDGKCKSFANNDLFGSPIASFALSVDIQPSMKILLYAHADTAAWYKAANTLLHGTTLCMYDGFANEDAIQTMEELMNTTHSIIECSVPYEDGLWDKVKGWF